MYKKLSRHGNSLAIIIDKPILELLSVNEKTVLKIRTDGTNIIIEPVMETKDLISKNPKFQAIFEKVTEKYDEDLKKLADS